MSVKDAMNAEMTHFYVLSLKNGPDDCLYTRIQSSSEIPKEQMTGVVLNLIREHWGGVDNATFRADIHEFRDSQISQDFYDSLGDGEEVSDKRTHNAMKRAFKSLGYEAYNKDEITHH